MLSPSTSWAGFWFNMRILPFALIPVFWFIFSLYYVGMDSLINRKYIILLFIIPLLTQIFLWSNNIHGLWVKDDVVFIEKGPFYIAETMTRVIGPWYRIHLLYSYILMIAGIIIIFNSIIRMFRKYRQQALFVGIGTSIMVIGSFIPNFNMLPGLGINMIIPFFSIGAVIIALGLYRHRFLREAPRIIEGTRTPLAIILLFVMMTIGILSAAFAYYRQYSLHHRIEIERNLSTIADLKVREISQWRNERMGDANTLYKNDAFTTLFHKYMLNPTDTVTFWWIKTWLLKINTSYRYDHVMLLDSAGEPIVSIPQDDEHLCKFIKNKLDEPRKSQNIEFLDFHRESPKRRIHLSIIIPIVYEKHETAIYGFVVLLINPYTFLYPMINRWPGTSRTGETLIVRREGNDVLFLNELKFNKNSALELRFPLSKNSLPAAMAAQGKEGIVEGIDYRGTPVIAALRTIPDSPWHMVARMDMEEVYAPVRERFWIMSVLITAIIAAAGTGIWLIWRRRDEQYIRERYESAIALKASEEKFSTAFRTSPYAITITRADNGEFVDVNDAFVSITGYARDEAMTNSSIGLNIWVAPEDRNRIVTRLLNGNMVSSEEYRFRNKNGDIIIGLFSAQIIQIDNEVLILSSINDITSRKIIEDELRNSEAMYRELVQNANSVILRWKTDGTITFFNEFAQSFFGYSVNEAVGKHVSLIVPDMDSTGKELSSLISNIVNEPEKYINNINENICKDGRRVWMAWTNKPIVRDGIIEEMLAIATDITDRRMADLELERLAQQKQVALNASNMGWWHYDPETKIATLDDRYREIFKVSGHKNDNAVILNMLHPDDLPRVWASVEAAMNPNDPKPYSEVYRVNRSDGSQIWVEAHGLAEFTGEGRTRKAVSLVGTVADITERINAQNRLRKINRTYALLSEINKTIVRVHNTPDLFYEACRISVDIGEFLFAWIGVLDLDTMKIIPVSHAGKNGDYIVKLQIALDDSDRGKGPTSTALLKNRHVVVNDIEHDPIMMPWRDEALKRGFRASAAFPISISDEEMGVFNLYARDPDFFDDEELELLDEMAEDISFALITIDREFKRHKAEEELKSTYAKLERMSSSNIVGVAIADPNGGLQMVNDYYLNLMGYTREEFDAGLVRWNVRTPPEHLTADNHAIEELRERGVCTPYEKEYIRKDGTRVWVLIADALIPGPEEQILAFVLDITERKRAEEEINKINKELERSNMDLQQFAYIASHDLQEPLRMISSYLQLIERRYKDKLDDDANDFINFAVDGAVRLQSLISGLLEFSRVKTHGKSFGIVRVKNVVDDVCKDLNLFINETGAVIEYGNLPDITGDDIQIGRIFQNLLQNAIKFRMKGVPPRVTITAEHRGSEYIFSVKDNGIGIEKQYYDKIFMIFQRLHSREEYSGTGIGLAVCKRIVERHGGKIWVESIFGEGSSFYFTIPGEII